MSDAGKTMARAGACFCFLSAIAVTMTVSIKYMGLSDRAAVLNDVVIDPAPTVLPYDRCGDIFIDPIESTSWTQTYKFASIVYMMYSCLFICVALCLFFPPAMFAGVCCLGCVSTTTVVATILAAIRRFGDAGNAC